MKTKTVKRRAVPVSRKPREHWDLRIYVAGETLKSISAFQNLKAVCEIHLKGQYRILMIDLLKHPELAKKAQITAIPTVVRKLPRPVRTLIGNLYNAERVLVGLGLRTNN